MLCFFVYRNQSRYFWHNNSFSLIWKNIRNAKEVIKSTTRESTTRMSATRRITLRTKKATARAGISYFCINQAARDRNKLGTMSHKHAYLIMAHDHPDELRAFSEAVDDERNDLFVHIDASAGPEMAPREFENLCTKAHMSFIPSAEVNWGGYSAIKTEMRLLESAVAFGSHSYYHFIQNPTYPILNQNQIHSFFEQHKGLEFIPIDTTGNYDLVKYIWLFNETAAHTATSASDRLKLLLRSLFVKFQKLLGYDHFAPFAMEFKKGLVLWSITQACAEYVIAHKNLIHKMMRHSVVGDEIFMQTLVYNSPFKTNIYQVERDVTDTIHVTTWPLENAGIERPGHVFLQEDLDFILSSGALFARKIQDEDGKVLRHELSKRWN